MCGKANVGMMHVKRIGTDVNNDIVLFTLAARHVVAMTQLCQSNCGSRLSMMHAERVRHETRIRTLVILTVIFFRRYPSLSQTMDGQYRRRARRLFPAKTKGRRS